MTRTSILLVLVLVTLVGPGLAENGEDSVSDNPEDARLHRGNGASDNMDNAASDNTGTGAGDALAHMMHTELVGLGELRVTGPGYIHVAMILVRGQQEDKVERMAANLRRSASAGL